MTKDVARYEQNALAERWKYAQAVASAEGMLPKGMVGQIRDADGNMRQGVVPGRVFLALETGAMLGVHPMAALQGINVIEGSASISPALMQALVRRAGHKLRVDLYGTIEGGDIRAVAKLTRSDEPDDPYIVEWTPFDALRAGLIDSYARNAEGIWEVRARSSQKDAAKPWEAYHRSMLKWRAQSEVVRDGAEDVLMGVHYTAEELGAVVNDDGTIEPVSAEDFLEQQNGVIARIGAIVDKADMATLWKELHDDDVWTPKVDAEFSAHLATLTVDSRPPKNGAPGNTGSKVIDGNGVEPAAAGASDVVDAEVVESDAPDGEPVTEATGAATGEMTAEEYEAQQAAEYAEYLEAQEAARADG